MLKPDIGHNQPPDMTQTASDTMQAISDWMKDHPAIEGEKEAKEAKVLIDRGRLCIKDLEDERDGKVRPLNTQVKEINNYYKGPRETLQRVLNEVEARITSFLHIEEEKRARAAEEARLAAEAAEAAARDAHRIEQERIDDARSGEVGVDVAALSRDADRAFDEYQRAERTAALLERNTKAKIAGGFSRAVSLKTVEVLTVTDPFAVLGDIGLTDDIRDAMLKSARAYRKVFGELPNGIKVETERKI